MNKPPITLEKLQADFQRKVRAGEIGKWTAFSEFVIVAHYWLPNRHQNKSIHAHIRWAARQMDILEGALAQA